jgi:hypothetical protein
MEKKRMNVRDFIVIFMQHYNENKTIKDFSESIGQPIQYTRTKIGYYRKKGIKLPPLYTEGTRHPAAINPAECNALIASLKTKSTKQSTITNE